MRGKALEAGKTYALLRITPAGAGKSPVDTAINAIQRDHPRRCGEKSVFRVSPTANQGSPPQVRGKVTRGEEIRPFFRITPAGAGKRTQVQVILNKVRDHPRRCGEKIVLIPPSSNPIGSPPQVRGKGINNAMPYVLVRITPAGAGKRVKSGLHR